MHRIGRPVTLALAATLAFSVPVQAQQEAGDKSVQLSGMLQAGEGFSSGSVFAGLGYFVSKNIEVQGNVGLILSDAGGTSSTTTTLGGAGKYYLVTEGRKTYPYVGGEVGMFLSSGSDALVLLRPHAGSNTYLNRNMAINIDAGYLVFLSEGATGMIDARVGFKFIF